MSTIELDRPTARRIAIEAQQLSADRPTALEPLVHRLTLLQIDPTAAIAPAADLVAWSRLGNAYRPEQLTDALEKERSLFEFDAMIRPMRDLPIFLAFMHNKPLFPRHHEWLTANAVFREEVLRRLAAEGPLPSRSIPETASVPWESSGWSNDRSTTQLLELLVRVGDVAISHRVGRERHFDLAERVYPNVDALPLDEAQRLRDERRLASLGIAPTKAPEQAVEPTHVNEAGLIATVEGVSGTWRVDPAALERAQHESSFTGRTAILSPFDRLTYDRKRALAFWNFEYTLEMYKPASARRWGYFALPVLHGDALIGKIDAAADRKAGTLTVNAIHEDNPFDTETRDAVNAELDSLAAWLGLERR